MNPYVSFSIAMCGVVFLALAGTAYLSIYFNRRAKADMQHALEPLAQVIDGEVDLDEGRVRGRYSGQIAEGAVTNMPGGMSRVFVISIVEAAGGEPWKWMVTRSKEPGGPDEADFVESVPGVTERLKPLLEPLAGDPDLAGIWYRVEYVPSSGILTLTRPMRVRRDIPSAEAFQQHLDVLVAAAVENRAAQGPAVS